MPLARLEVSPCTRVMSTYDCYIFLMKVSSAKSAQSVSSNIYLFYLSCPHLFESHIFFLYINIICIFYFRVSCFFSRKIILFLINFDLISLTIFFANFITLLKIRYKFYYIIHYYYFIIIIYIIYNLYC